MNRCKLGSLLRIQHGYAFKSENYVESSQYRLITLGNFADGNSFKYNDEKATYYGAEFPKEFILEEGDLIMPMTEQVVGLFGNTAFVPKTENYTFVLNQRVGKVIYDEKKIDKYYLHYLLATNSVKQQIEARASGTRQRNISPENVYDVEVDIPNISIQEKIGKLLYSIEEKQINNSKINAELEAIAKTIYDYWFLQFDFPDENGKPYKSSGGKMVWNDELKREIPEGWSVDEMSSYIDFISGYPFSSEDYVDKGKYKLYTIKNVQDGKIIPNVDNCLNQLPENLPQACCLKEGDLIMSLTGNVGRVGLVYENNALLNQRVLKLVSKGNHIAYIYLLFRNNATRTMLETIATGTSQKNLSPINVGKIKTIVPSNLVLKKFDDICNGMIEKIVANHIQNQELTSLRDFLLPLLMNGQVGFKN